jgi:hypothetical protein
MCVRSSWLRQLVLESFVLQTVLVQSAVVLAARTGNLPVLQHVITSYAVDITRCSCCAICVICTEPQVRDAMHQNDANHRLSVNASALLGAASGGHVHILRFLLEAGAPPEVGNEVRPLENECTLFTSVAFDVFCACFFS